MFVSDHASSIGDAIHVQSTNHTAGIRPCENLVGATSVRFLAPVGFAC